MSSDDFYLTFEERCKLQEQHPFLKYRGPPGTHDVEMIREVFASLRAGTGTRIPIFDKSLHGGQGDRTGFKEYESTADVDLVVFEGWFNGFVPFEEAPTDSVDSYH